MRSHRDALVRRTKRGIVIALALALVWSCSREVHQGTAVSKRQEPADGGRVVRRIESDVKTLNYILHTEEDERQVLAYVHDPLIALDQNLQAAPGIAVRWEINNGGREYLLHLDPRATFSDGTPVTGRDVVFTLNAILEHNSPQFSAAFSSLDRTRTVAIDDRTVRVVFTEARAAQLLAFNIGVLPERVYGRGVDFMKTTAVVGTGPYVLKERKTGQSILLVRRPDYWRERPAIGSILFRIVSDDTVAWNALMRGDLDVGRVSNEIWWREKDKPAVLRQVRFVDAWLLAYNCFAWNLEHPLFRDVRTRRALALSFDRDAVVDRLYHGQARPVSGPFTPDQWAYNPAILPAPFDLREAASLLREAGWRDVDGDGTLDRGGHAFAFTMLIPVSPTARDQAQILQDALRQIGVRMEISAMDSAAFFDRVLHRNFEAAFFAWNNEVDPDPYALFHSSQLAPEGLNVGGYRSREADALMDRGRRELDPAARRAIYHELHAVLARDQPYLFTVQVASKWAVNGRVQNVRVSRGFGLFLWQPGPVEWRVQ
ncbi:MAG: ABC transporter substrate-binding protein [Acidobacteriota bacterium]